jgi:hypothetical protein
MKNKNSLLTIVTLLTSYCLNAQTLTFQNGATLLIERGGILTTESNLEIPNGAIDNRGTIKFTGSSAKNFDANGQAIKGIIEFNAGTTTLTDRLIVPAGEENFGVIKITGTGVLNSGNKLTLIIDSLGYTGRIDEITSSASNPLISNSDSLILYTTSGVNAHRLLGNPFKTTLQIKQYFDDTLEFDVTGPGGTTNGFSVNTGSNNPSAFKYDEANNKWAGYAHANDSIQVGKGAAIYIQNRKGQPLQTWGAAFPFANRINLFGGFRSGQIKTELSTDGSGWNLISNPYPSNISISTSKSPGNKWKNVGTSVYYYDKKNKSYITYNRSNGAKTGKMKDVIPMGSSFIVQADVTKDSNFIVFEEGMKTDALPSSDNSNPHFFEIDTVINRFGITLTNRNKGKSEEDQVVLLFGNDVNSTELYDRNYDTRDFPSDVVNLAIISDDNYKLAISSYPQAPKEYENQVFPLSFKTQDTGVYSFQYDYIGAMDAGIEVWLKDKSLNKVFPIYQTPYFFKVRNKNTTSTDNRFELVFKYNLQALSNEDDLNSNNSNSLSTQVYPNPVASGQPITLRLPQGYNSNQLEIILVDASGKMVDVKPSAQTASKWELTLNTKHLTPGIYYLQILTAQDITSHKLIINP